MKSTSILGLVFLVFIVQKVTKSLYQQFNKSKI